MQKKGFYGVYAYKNRSSRRREARSRVVLSAMAYCTPEALAISSAVRLRSRRMSSSAFNTRVVGPRSVSTSQVLGVEKLTGGCGQVVQAVQPQQFMPICTDQRNAFLGRRQRKGAHGQHASVHRAIGQGQRQAAMGVAVHLWEE